MPRALNKMMKGGVGYNRIARAQRELDLALADGRLQPLGNALPEQVDSAFRMSLRSAERRDHLCTDLVYRRSSGKPFDFKRSAVLLLFSRGVAEREGFETLIGPRFFKSLSGSPSFRATRMRKRWRPFTSDPCRQIYGMRDKVSGHDRHLAQEFSHGGDLSCLAISL